MSNFVEANIISLIRSEFGPSVRYIYPQERLESNPKLVKYCKDVFHLLGGKTDTLPLRPGRIDYICNDFMLEIDEEQHFNRYRATTLMSEFYDNYKNFYNTLNYIDFCIDYEAACTKKASWGQLWTSPRAEIQFGSPGRNGDFKGPGSPRWKQRAYYDFLKDVYSVESDTPLIRISIFDKLGQTHCQLRQSLSDNKDTISFELINFINSKLIIK